MGKFSGGFVAGSILTAFGVGWLMSDAKMRRRIIHDGRRAMRRASDMIG